MSSEQMNKLDELSELINTTEPDVDEAASEYTFEEGFEFDNNALEKKVNINGRKTIRYIRTDIKVHLTPHKLLWSSKPF